MPKISAVLFCLMAIIVPAGVCLCWPPDCLQEIEPYPGVSCYFRSTCLAGESAETESLSTKDHSCDYHQCPLPGSLDLYVRPRPKKKPSSENEERGWASPDSGNAPHPLLASGPHRLRATVDHVLRDICLVVLLI